MGECELVPIDVLLNGYAIRLPTEAEWKVAAAYDGQVPRRMYPWSDAPELDADHAIFADAQGNRLGAAAPVGVCAAGAAACGAVDMAGNVGEWCASSYKAHPQGAAAFTKDVTPDDYDVPRRGVIFCEIILHIYHSTCGSGFVPTSGSSAATAGCGWCVPHGRREGRC